MAASNLPATWRASFELYSARDPESARIRAAHVAQVVRLTPWMMLANGINAAVVSAAVGPVKPQPLIGWLLAMVLVMAFALRNWWRRRASVPERASPRALHRATAHATALGLVWAAVPQLWFVGAAPEQQLLLAMLACGMMAGGVLALSPLPQAALAYTGVIAVSAIVALLRDGSTTFHLVALLVVCYTAALAVAALANERRATALLRARRAAERQRHGVSLLLRDFEDHAADALWAIGREGRLTHWSPRLAQLLGETTEDRRRQSLVALLERASPQAAAQLGQALEAGQPFHALRLCVPDGDSQRWWSLSGKPLLDQKSHVLGWRGVIADVTAEERAQLRLHTLAHFDSLTGLANRLTLHEALQQRLQRGDPGALLSVDLDHFKAINDSLGHSSGDAVLKMVAGRLAATVRPGDLVARLGGDEFAILLTEARAAAEAMVIAERVVAALSEPCRLRERQVRVGASVGIAMLGDDGRDVDELLGNADLALYHAKGGGRGRCVAYSAELGERSRRRSDIEHGLRAAAAAGELTLHWQPQVDVQAWRIVGAEALLRWRHPTLGAVAPAEFVTIAEQAGIIEVIGDWVLQEACRTAARHLPGLNVSINVSAAQLRDGAFAERAREVLQQTRLAPERLELEITESIFLDDVEGAIGRLHALHKLGVRIALDDFGTGYSSLSYLRRFPFDTLKIDRTFISELRLRSDARAIVRMIAELAGHLGMRTIAEGVETEAQLAQVAGAGCQDMQGYLVSRPCTLGDFKRLLERWVELAPPATVH